MSISFFALAAISLQAASADSACDASDIIGSSKSITNLRPAEEPGDAPIGAVIRTETTSYGADGRRNRVEWRNADGEVSLTFVELYGDSDQPYGAFYVTDGSLEPTLEAFTWSEDNRRKLVEYRKANGEVTGRALFIADAEGREIERRYGVDGDTYSSSDVVTYDGKNESGYTWSRADGSSRSEVVYDIESVDAKGNWTVRRVIRNGNPTMRERRAISYRNCAA